MSSTIFKILRTWTEVGSVQVYNFEVGNAILREEFSHPLGGNIAIDTHNSERICANGRAAERYTGNVDVMPGKDGARPGPTLGFQIQVASNNR